MAIGSLFIDDLSSATPNDLREAIVSLANSRIEEKFRLDFKETWTEDRCKDVAAMANTYGGLLVLGVSDDRARFPGIEPPKNSDLKTQISATIASRISPTPIFETHTCPGDNGNFRLVVIRVAAAPRLHLYLKGDKPVFVRNEDQTVPTTASVLRGLLDRVRAAESTSSALCQPLRVPTSDFLVTRAMDRSAPAATRRLANSRAASQTFIHIGLCPEQPATMALNKDTEHKFEQLVLGSYPSIGDRIELDTSVVVRRDRRKSWYLYGYSDFDRDHEAMWLLTQTAGIQYMCETNALLSGSGEFWSIPDLIVNIESTLRVAHTLWANLGYFGEGLLGAKLQVSTLKPFHNDSWYSPLFYETGIQVPLTSVVEGHGLYPATQADCELSLGYDDRARNKIATIVNLLNALLRDLRYQVNTDSLHQLLAKLV